MAFVQITDPDKAMELYRAGLLWEKRLFDGEPYECYSDAQERHRVFGLLLED